jgi:hypothetical protein
MTLLPGLVVPGEVKRIEDYLARGCSMPVNRQMINLLYKFPF